ncbi:Succinate dehydrogenase assembly factor 4, mitochondrial [Smittium mucronatum]|uniref:Succinate dehydrogenase assembly factor 4, mitochondrial n=1 Tax=Smittium mucronatum TaxID=133383 RepID=A0A1R0H1Q8_9FUNG|nr:Succinate dehydrogenase assembly factor 4, mitochondrial [Smittium mucronatum]OLY83061.1 Succinate dehydrogenase assembly factor 4, mitochondrial [Smittium mucronatum]
MIQISRALHIAPAKRLLSVFAINSAPDGSNKMPFEKQQPIKLGDKKLQAKIESKLLDSENKMLDSSQETKIPMKDHEYEPFENNTNPSTGEIGGPKGPEPTRYGDWERKGRVSDF